MNKDHKDLDPSLHCVIEQDYPFEYPTYDEVENTIREITLMEKYQNRLYALSEREKEYQGSIITLEPGQYIDENGVLQNIPKIKGVKVEWDWKTHKWEEKATFEEIIEERKNKILKYSELEKEKRALEGSKFSSENEILSVPKGMIPQQIWKKLRNSKYSSMIDQCILYKNKGFVHIGFTDGIPRQQFFIK